MSENKAQNSIVRPPIVVVLGHVDHGKTTLLDYIRKTNVVAKEAGGITQSTGAYEIIHVPHESQINADSDADKHGLNISENQRSNQRKSAAKRITFIDTPGHEAFSKMRQRGANAADLGILVVAADEGVKPQTKEAIQVLLESKTPFIVAINKIDKNNADVEKVKGDLAQAGVLVEGFGGNISWQAISAKKGDGVDELLDLILLAAELEDLKYDPSARASGFVIESKMDSRRGLTVFGIVKDGILKVGDEIATQNAVGKIKILETFLGERVNQLEPSAPALILGFESLPQTGEEFYSGKVDIAELAARSIAQRAESLPAVEETAGTLINIVLKADVSGSLEVFSEIIKAMPEIRIITEGIGDIIDSDIKNAAGSKAVVAAFKSKVTKSAEALAKTQGIKIISSEIIYDLVKKIEEELKELRAPLEKNELKVLAVFGKKGNRQIIGGRVEMGEFKKNLSVDILRSEKDAGRGRIINIQKGKEDAPVVVAGEECGLLFESETMVNVGDKLIY